MKETEADTWISRLGWQHEVAHTAVLRALLDYPSTAARCAQGLLGGTVTVDDVEHVCPEQQGFGGRPGSKADLTLIARIEGETKHVAVETKVHSGATWEQLRDTTKGDAYGVLLAPGRVGLRIDRGFMDGIETESGATWSHLDVQGWSQVFRQTTNDASLPGWIVDYAAELSAKAEAQRRNLDAAKTTGDDRRRCPDVRCAWLRAMRERLEPDLAENWSAEGRLSGEILYNNFGKRWCATNNADLYLAFDANPERIMFTVRAGAGNGGDTALRALWENEDLGSALEKRGLLRGPPPRRNSKTCTVAAVCVSAYSAEDGAALVQRAKTALDTARDVALEAANTANARIVGTP